MIIQPFLTNSASITIFKHYILDDYVVDTGITCRKITRGLSSQRAIFLMLELPLNSMVFMGIVLSRAKTGLKVISVTFVIFFFKFNFL